MAGSEDVEAHGSGSVLAGALVAVAVNTLPAWGAWTSLEDPRERTVLASDIDTWLIAGLAIDLVDSGGSLTG